MFSARSKFFQPYFVYYPQSLYILFRFFADAFSDPNATLSDHLLHALLLLLDKEVSDHGRHLVHYFTLFHMYAALGLDERAQLLKVKLIFRFF